MNGPIWFSWAKRPRAYTPIICINVDGIEYHGLCYSKHRAEIIEPVTNQAAEPVIGKIKKWRYS